MCTGEKETREDEKREREKGRKVEGRISRDAGTFLSSRSTISSSRACDDRFVEGDRENLDDRKIIHIGVLLLRVRVHTVLYIFSLCSGKLYKKRKWLNKVYGERIL